MTYDYEIYTDGSYLRRDKTCGYAAVIKCNIPDKEGIMSERVIYGKVTDKELVDMWNVGGEIKAVEVALKYCAENSFNNIIIYHDYNGLGFWVNGKWKTNKPATASYKALVNQYKSSGMNVSFQWVKGHSNIPGNMLADQYANYGRKVPDNTMLTVKLK